MSKKKQKKAFPAALHHTDAKSFLAKPKTFAEKIGITLKDLECPPEAHAAFARGQAFANDASRQGIETNEASLKKLTRLAKKHFGNDYEANFVPFGLQFREKIKINPSVDWTGSGTGTVTFADTDGDVDG
jgi:hypothetical protein